MIHAGDLRRGFTLRTETKSKSNPRDYSNYYYNYGLNGLEAEWVFDMQQKRFSIRKASRTSSNRRVCSRPAAVALRLAIQEPHTLDQSKSDLCDIIVGTTRP